MALELERASVPVSLDPCRTCADPCDVGHLEYPKLFDVDTAGDMLGSVKPYLRQIVISTGKADWVREVTEEDDSLASFISQEADHAKGILPSPSPETTAGSSASPALSHTAIAVPSYPPSKPTSRLSILNGSHKSREDADGQERHRVLVLPDYKVVTHIPKTRAAAESLFTSALSAKVGRTGNGEGKGETRSYVLPYACVILLCSHKKRDNRCHIAAPKLQDSFCNALEAEGWHVDLDVRDEDCMGKSIEEVGAGEEGLVEREGFMVEKLKEAAEGSLTGQKLALILKCSHIGGHKYAGNAIIYTPQGPHTGTGVWYGRVSPHEVPAVVKHTILGGRVLPSLLRGGVNLSREGGRSLLDW